MSANARIASAMLFAAQAHQGQVRKYTGEPYINHPIAVSDLVRRVSTDENMIIAALLHDTLEDTDVSAFDIWQRFGSDVEGLVSGLTDPVIEGNRATRKAAAKAHLAEGDCRVKTIKLADLIDNTKSIVQHDPKFAKVYLAEKEELLTVLTQGDRHLFNVATQLLWESKARLR